MRNDGRPKRDQVRFPDSGVVDDGKHGAAKGAGKTTVPPLGPGYVLDDSPVYHRADECYELPSHLEKYFRVIGIRAICVYTEQAQPHDGREATQQNPRSLHFGNYMSGVWWMKTGGL